MLLLGFFFVFNGILLGVSLLDLCNLGSEWILVMENGWWYVLGIEGMGFVDVNIIFIVLFRNVEVFIGGVLVVYGVDVVIGVVNFNMRNGVLFDGLEFCI